MRNIFLGLAGAAAVAHVATLIAIMAALDRRGQKTNMFLARVCPWKYVKAYKEATRKETGRPGPLYALWILTINLTLALAVAGLIMPGR